MFFMTAPSSPSRVCPTVRKTGRPEGGRAMTADGGGRFRYVFRGGQQPVVADFHADLLSYGADLQCDRSR
jgi:hypothetical protein